MLDTNKIVADAVTLRTLLNEQKFTIGYFQREYRWEERHMVQLVDDLTGTFLNDYDPEHDRKEVANYNTYYMGPIVLNDEGSQLSVIDGQQRLTSLTLLLIYLHHRQKNEPSPKGVEPVATLIHSELYGEKSYNLQVPERERCLNALFADGSYSVDGERDESVLNLVARYDDISGHFPDEVGFCAIPQLTAWVKEKLVFVKIVAGDEEKAYTIFETMNDRGLRLSDTEMLKSYLLSKIKDAGKRDQLNARWKAAMVELHQWQNKEEDLEFFKAWFRAKYAQSIRIGRKGAVNQDFEKIGTAFHRWFKANERDLIGLKANSDFLPFVESTFDFYRRLYLRIGTAQREEIAELPRLRAISWFPIASSLAIPLLVAPITPEDSERVQEKKMELVAHMLDCFAVYRAVNHTKFGHESIRYAMCSLVKEVRNMDVYQLASFLKEYVQTFPKLDGIQSFNLNQQNKKFVRYLLARVTTYIESGSGIDTHLDKYMTNEVKKPFQVEHIWSNTYERHVDEFDQTADFQWHRNTLGGLILLPKGTNQSIGDNPYEEKLPAYLRDSLLAQSLHEDCYKNNPNFTKWFKAAGLPFQPHKQFKKADLEARTALYQAIAEQIWSPTQFDQIANP